MYFPGLFYGPADHINIVADSDLAPNRRHDNAEPKMNQFIDAFIRQTTSLCSCGDKWYHWSDVYHDL